MPKIQSNTVPLMRAIAKVQAAPIVQDKAPDFTLRRSCVYRIRTPEGWRPARYEGNHCSTNGNPQFRAHSVTYTVPMAYVQRMTKDEVLSEYLGRGTSNLATMGTIDPSMVIRI